MSAFADEIEFDKEIPKHIYKSFSEIEKEAVKKD